MRLKELRGLPVIDPTAARKLGTVIDYQIDPVAGRIAALDITPVDGTDSQRVLAQRIRRVGSSAVVLTARGGTLPSDTVDINSRWLDTATTVGLEVMGDDGNRIGHLGDCTFNQDTLDIEAYLLRGASLLQQLIGGRARIPPDQVHACSRELMIVGTGQVTTAEAQPDEVTSVETVPLKEADRPAVPEYEPVPDGRSVGVGR
jgi:sporulation protein YlmC with PRC-barrel domain